MFSLESPHQGHSNEYTQYTLFNIKKKMTLNYPKIAAIPFFFQGTQEGLWNKLSHQCSNHWRSTVPGKTTHLVYTDTWYSHQGSSWVLYHKWCYTSTSQGTSPSAGPDTVGELKIDKIPCYHSLPITSELSRRMSNLSSTFKTTLGEWVHFQGKQLIYFHFCLFFH